MVECSVDVYGGIKKLTEGERLLLLAVGGYKFRRSMSNVKEVYDIKENLRDYFSRMFFENKVQLYERKEIPHMSHLPFDGVSISNEAMKQIREKGYTKADDLVKLIKDEDLVVLDSSVVPREFGDLAILTTEEFNKVREKYQF